jgi:glucose/arabinose dehydrogenase/plastocyanin
VRLATAVSAAALIAATLQPAHAQQSAITAFANTFAPGGVTIAQGDTLTFANADIAPHNVVADATTKHGPLFASDTVTIGGQAVVKGANTLAPSTYTFHCSVHPQMRGTLTVTAPGSTAYAFTPTGATVATPTSITIHDSTLYAASYTTGDVTSYAILPGGALAGGTTYATGFDAPLGLAFAPDGTLYVSDSHDVNGRRQGRVSAVKNGAKTTVIDGLPNGRHNTNGLVVQGNRLYVANGNATDDGVSGGPQELPLNGTVLSYALPVRKGAKPRIEAKGLRNPYDLAFRPGTNELWFTTNGPDAQAPYGVDLLHKLTPGRTADFGFPRCVYDDALKPKDANACRHKATPAKSLGLHVSADGVAFGWGGDLFVAEYGSNDYTSPAGHKVVRVDMHDLSLHDVVVGPAPLDVAFGPDGLYVADADSGVISLIRAVA